MKVSGYAGTCVGNKPVSRYAGKQVGNVDRYIWWLGDGLVNRQAYMQANATQVRMVEESRKKGK